MIIRSTQISLFIYSLKYLLSNKTINNPPQKGTHRTVLSYKYQEENYRSKF